MISSSKMVDNMLDQLEQVKIGYLINTDEKMERFRKAAKHGYSTEFALIFALQG